MLRLLAIAFMLGTTLVASSLADDKDKAKFDQKKLIGTWKVVKGIPPEAMKEGVEFRVEFTETTFKPMRVKDGKTIDDDKTATWKLDGGKLTLTRKEKMPTTKSTAKDSKPVEKEVTTEDTAEITKLTDTELHMSITEHKEKIELELERMKEKK